MFCAEIHAAAVLEPWRGRSQALTGGPVPCRGAATERTAGKYGKFWNKMGLQAPEYLTFLPET